MANLNNSLSLNEQRATTKKVWEPKSMVNFPSMCLTDANKSIRLLVRLINRNKKKLQRKSRDISQQGRNFKGTCSKTKSLDG